MYKMDRRTIPFSQRRHGESKTRLFSVWVNMRHRCNSNNEKWHSRYGCRGIRVCDEWENDFLAFKKWSLENGYGDTKTIDRIDNDGNYEPSNCRWTDLETQLNNTSRSHFITYDGETRTVSQWCRHLGLSEKTVSSRLERGWTPEQAFTAPKHARPNGRHDDISKMKHVAQKDDNGKIINVFSCAGEASRETGVCAVNIAHVCNGERKHAGGYVWEYFRAIKQ